MVKQQKHYDWILIGVTFFLGIFGLMMVYSASFPLGIDIADNPAYFFTRQVIWFIIGAGVFFTALHFPYTYYQKLTPFIVGTCILLLLAVIVVGTEVNGARRWLSFGPFQLQPSEFVKIAVIIYLANVYSKKQHYITHFVRGVLPPLIVVVFMFGLIMMQPDLGTGLMVLLIGGMIIFLAGAKWSHLVSLAVLGGGVAVFLAMQAPYRIQRLVAFRDPFEWEAEGSGHQLIQSYIAIANGGVTGNGLGQSVQKMHYLPEPHTDFIFAVIAEELGILGLLFIVGCFAVIALRGFAIGRSSRDAFGKLLAFGIVFFLLTQALFNLAAATGLMPITGITLPLVSYGGSSLLVCMLCLGILTNISKTTKKLLKEERVQSMQG